MLNEQQFNTLLKTGNLEEILQIANNTVPNLIAEES
ncbi:hypothetical protein CG399_00165 [Bifidobacteriaceae bacterium NR015]|nr:hypothetical protein CG399_00165 [Bifidobacteriaceae bacterium NR015]